MTPALLLALLGAAAPPPPAIPAAEPASVEVRLSKREVRLGETFELTVEIRHRPAERYSPDRAFVVEPFRLVGSDCPRRPDGADAVTTCSLRLALYDLGPHDLPGLTLPVETPEGARVLRVPGVTLTGVGILDPGAPPEALALKDLAPPVPLRVPNLPLLLGAVAALGALAAAWLAWRAWRRRALRATEPPAPLPPHERFALQLQALEDARLPGLGRTREHFFRLSEHVREYLGAVTGQNALDLTTSELLARLGFQPDPRLDLAGLRAFLESADLVKFARAPAGAAEAGEALAWARALLDRTRPSPPAPAPPEGGSR